MVNYQLESILKWNIYSSFDDWINLLEDYLIILPIEKIPVNKKKLISRSVLQKRGAITQTFIEEVKPSILEVHKDKKLLKYIIQEQLEKLLFKDFKKEEYKDLSMKKYKPIIRVKLKVNKNFK